MANPQLDDGYTCIAHELLEAFCKVNLSPYESRVMWYLLRKTYGYKQKMDEIPVSQFSEATGLDKRNAGRAVRSLKEKNMIATDGKQIGLQKDYDKWCVSPKIRNVSVSTETPNRHQQRHGNGVSRDTSKDIKIKDSSSHRKKREHADTDPRVNTLLLLSTNTASGLALPMLLSAAKILLYSSAS
jgi:phage replication O-like protein O